MTRRAPRQGPHSGPQSAAHHEQMASGSRNPPPQASQHDELSLGAPEDGICLLLIKHFWKQRERL